MKIKAKHNEEIEKGMRAENALCFRSVDMEVMDGGQDKKPSVRMTVSSEAPVLSWIRMGDQGMYAYEILDHSESSIDRSRCADGLIVQDTHHGDQVGLIRAPMITDKKLGGLVEFCTGERACEIEADAAKGLRRNVSVGYMVDGASYRIEGELNGYPLVRAMRWTPYEASFVPVPADTAVGVGRSLEKPIADKPAERGHMDPKEMAEFFTRALAHGIDATEAQALLDAGKTRADLDSLIVERQDTQITELRTVKAPVAGERKQLVTEVPKTDVPANEMRQFSVNNVIRSILGDRVDIGREREISEQLAKERNKPATGIIIPHAVLAQRVLTVAGTSSATVQTTVMDNEFIDLVRSASILGELGVRFMPGIVGNIAYPKMTAGATGYWVAENGDITGSTPTLGQVPGTPHTCGALVDLSRLMINQSTPASEQFTRNEIIERVARTIQIAVFAGTGADGQPSAITTATGIANPTISSAGTPTYAEILAFVGTIMNNSSAGAGMKWAMTGEVWAKLAATATNGAGSPLALDPNSRRLAGYGYAEPCSDLPANSLWFGDWSTVMIPIWGNGVDLIVDTSTLSKSGGTRLVGLQDVDICVRNGMALAYNTAVTT